MNHFFAITSEGGYLGRLYWGNTKSTGRPDQWGVICWFHLHAGSDSSHWAGSFGLIRYLIKPLRQ